MTQMNTIDLSRRSPSYENRLSKYSHRGFEVYWPSIDRSRVDPTIFERSFTRVQGLARLLVLEKLPHPNDRDTYLAKRRAERGRPPLPWNARFRHELQGNVKDAQPDDVAEWVEEDEVSNYHTVAIPYGPKYHAKKIEKLLFTKDLLLNAEWNKPKDRKTKLHRHPAFFGSVNDVLHDCCGFCPKPVTDEDLAAFEEESKIYISGDVTFLKDDPGRQAIGSFNPITNDDWTDMAYVGNTTRLCQAIVDLDLDAVRDWFSSPEVVDVNRRDHTGRTPLQLAVMCSTPEIVQCLIEHGARLVARLYNGMTALHLAAHRGQVQMVKDILDKSDANEEAEILKEDARKDARRAAAVADTSSEDGSDKQDASDDDSFDSEDDFEDEVEADDVTEGSFVKVNDNVSPDENSTDDEPDVYDVDVLAWDSPLSPLHLAILAGRLDIIELLIDKYGADVLLPVKIVDEYNRKQAKAAILTITLALQLPLRQANETVRALLAHGATYTQADMKHISALNYAVSSAKTLILETMHSANQSHFASACNFIAISGYYGNANVNTPLLTAIRTGKPEVVDSLVRWGAKTHIDFESYAQAYKRSFDSVSNDPETMKKNFQKTVEQPIIVALQHDMVDFVAQLVEGGEDVNTLPIKAYNYLDNLVYQYSSWNTAGKSLLDLVEDRIASLQEYLNPVDAQTLEKPAALEEDSVYLDGYDAGSYSYWTAFGDLRVAKSLHQYQMKQYEKELRAKKQSPDEALKKAAIGDMIEKLLSLKWKLHEKGAKSFSELHPEAQKEQQTGGRLGYLHGLNNNNKEPYKTKISFNVSDLTPEKEANYIKLFEAAWTGNVETVKSLCLHGTRPLHVAVYDLRGFSPFSIAAIRGHYELARVVVEIAKAQYQPDDKSVRYHYRLGADEDDDSYSDEISDDERSEGSDNVRVHAQLVDEAFTVDDIAALEATAIKSRVSPSTMVAWNCQVARALQGHVDQRQVRDVFGGGFSDRHVYIGGQSKQSWAWFNAVLAATSQSMQRSLVRYAIVSSQLSSKSGASAE
jgi:ankyrin repeat protein